MKKRLVSIVGVLVALLALTAFTANERKITVFMIGDSTMANKSITGSKPERGWGHVLGGFFTEDIVVDNHAVNGRSSKSFIDEGRWDKVLSRIKPGDYVVIQFVISTLDINSNYLKLISALIVAVFLAVPYWKKEHFHGKAGKEKHHA